MILVFSDTFTVRFAPSAFSSLFFSLDFLYFKFLSNERKTSNKHDFKIAYI